MDNFIFPLLSFLAVAVLIPLGIQMAQKLKLIDTPDERKKHDGAVPLIGGVVIFPIFVIVAVLAGFSFSAYWPLYAGLAILLVTGVIDDRSHVRAWFKFGMQGIAAAILVFLGEVRLYQLGDMFGFGPLGLDFMWFPFSFAAVMLLINAINLIDGLDGLAAGVVSVALGWFAYGFYANGDAQSFALTMILIGCVGGFLVYNLRSPFRKKASVFLGDAGSLCLGLCLAWFAIHAGKDYADPAIAPIGVAWVLALPIMDTCAQFYRRARLGQHPFTPDRGHFHHHFVHAGISDGRAVFIILSLVFLMGGFGVLGLKAGIPQVVFSVSWIVLILVHMTISDKPERYIAFMDKVFKRSN